MDKDLPQLPQDHGENYISLLPRDPRWLFVCWEISQEYKEAARLAGGEEMAIRLFDVTGRDFDGTNAHDFRDHDCPEWARTWYLPVPNSGREYAVEIGYRGGDEWFPLSRSSTVTAPTTRPAPLDPLQQATIAFDQELAKLGEKLPGVLPLDENPSFSEQRVLVSDDGLRIQVSEAPDFYGLSSAASAAFPGSLGHLPGSPGSFSPGRSIPGSSLAARSSEAGLPRPLLEAVVDLVISGRTEPGADLSVAGQHISAGPDGCFSLRISMPEGSQKVPLEVRDSAGNVRQIRLRFGRDTR